MRPTHAVCIVIAADEVVKRKERTERARSVILKRSNVQPREDHDVDVAESHGNAEARSKCLTAAIPANPHHSQPAAVRAECIGLGLIPRLLFSLPQRRGYCRV